jgi:hypothetical protein
MMTLSDARPAALAVIQPIGSRSHQPREHSLTVTLGLSNSEARFADREAAGDVLRRSLEGFAPAEGEDDRRAFHEVTLPGRRRGVDSLQAGVVVSVEGCAEFVGRPALATIEGVRRRLEAEGYRVVIRERRECSELTCRSEVLLDWEENLPPIGWFSSAICGNHDYRTCATCKSVYLLHAGEAAEQATALPCEVCGALLVSWGGSKVVTAELVLRQPA